MGETGPRIALLDDNTASRIAAGEVVERPSSAVKELVENAVDAGATRISVLLEDGGKRRIEVIDNGCGMCVEDAVLSIQRHATSKIRDAGDLFSVQTLGFRGEALPSIASVSHFSLLTRAADSPVGASLEVHGGDLAEVGDYGGPPGTRVVVEELFYNTPARLKFLKSTATELARCLEIIGPLAIAYPGIAFHVAHGRQQVLLAPGIGDRLGAVAAVWGRDAARSTIEVRREEPSLSVDGFICPPDISKPGRSHELFLVNGRPVRSRLLSHALEEAVRALTPDARYPVSCLDIRIDPALVDVNVHPTKSEVKFTRDGDLHHAVNQAVKQALLTHGLLPTLGAGPERAAPTSRPDSVWRHPSLPDAPTPEAVSAVVDAFRPLGTPGASWPEPADDQRASGMEVGTESLADQLRGFRVLGQLRNTYIVAATEGGLALIDQHVAHERVLYERLLAARTGAGVPSQGLATPVTIELGAAEAGMVAQRLGDFLAAGWDLEPFGRDAFLVRGVPALLASRDYVNVLRDMVDELAHQSIARRLVVQRDQVTITNACKMAVKAGDSLSMPEMTSLVQQLASVTNPYACPHGRPAVVTVPISEIDRRFRR